MPRSARRLLPSVIAVAAALAVPSAAPAAVPATAPVGAFADVADVAPTVLRDVRYATGHNFVGRRIDGYEEPACLLTTPAAQALARVQADVRADGYTLKVYDCYRPQRAVNDFAGWASDPRALAMRDEFYRHVPKSRLFAEGYIARKSGHSRGSTVDLTLVKTPARAQARFVRAKLVDCIRPAGVRFGDNSIDMGTGYDCFSPRSWPSSTAVSERAQANRIRLRAAMGAAGFKPLKTEWWHFTLRDEPYKSTRFDFPVAHASVR